MRLLLPDFIVARLEAAVAEAGRREIGGILMAEHVAVDTFRIVDVTIQHQGGTFATFWRIVEVLVEPLRSFFERTKNEYTRFNYIGEWHSHHSFALVPSSTDRRAMRNVISETGARFIVLLLVRVDNDDHLEQAVTVFTATGQCFQGDVLLETGLG